MFRYISLLQQKPKETRRKFLLAVTFGLTLIIVLVWGIATQQRLSGKEGNDGPSPFSVIGKDLGEFYNNFKAGLKTIETPFER